MTPFLQAFRALRRRPAFALAAMLTLALGVGVTTALFSVVDTVLLKPLPFPDPDRLVTVYEATPAQRQQVSLAAPVRLADWGRLGRTFERISGSYSENVTDTSGAEPERLSGRRVLPGFFQVFGMRPLAGRWFTDDEERSGGPGAAIISESLWARRYQRDPGAVGRRRIVGGDVYTIVGVMPHAFTSATTDVWIPARLGPVPGDLRDARFVGGIGRLRPGVTIGQARADLARVQQALGEEFPETDRGWSAIIEDLGSARVGEYRRPVLLAFAAVGVLLLIAVANVAGLVLVQLHRRAAELAVRAAIGASRRQVVLAVMREIVLLAATGAVAGSALAFWLVGLIRQAFGTLPRAAELTVDWRAGLFVVGATAAIALLVGLLPSLHATRGSLLHASSAGGRGYAGGRHRFQGALVVAQMALSITLAGSAGLLIRSYQQISRADTGFDASNTLTFHVGAAWDEDRERVGRLQEQLVAELQRLPNVIAAGFTSFLPSTGATLRYQARLEGVTGPETDGQVAVSPRTIGGAYLQALRVPLLAGEWCPELRADSQTPATVLVNRRFVELYMPGQNPIGRRVRFDHDRGEGPRIIGVVGNIAEDGLGTDAAPNVYVCVAAGSWPDPEYVVRAAGDPAPLVAEIRQIVRRLDPGRPIFGVRPLEAIIGDALEQPRLNSQLLALFAAAAIGLAAVGLYGLLMLFVTERRRELGVRMALGASPGHIVRLVVAGAGRLVLVGAIAGLILTSAAGRGLRAFLFGVTPHDPLALAGAAAVLVGISLAAAWLPARQAARISAMDAMRET